MSEAHTEKVTAEQRKCAHPAGYLLDGKGVLRCVDCGAPSESRRWRQNVYGKQS